MPIFSQESRLSVVELAVWQLHSARRDSVFVWSPAMPYYARTTVCLVYNAGDTGVVTMNDRASSQIVAERYEMMTKRGFSSPSLARGHES